MFCAQLTLWFSYSAYEFLFTNTEQQLPKCRITVMPHSLSVVQTFSFEFLPAGIFCECVVLMVLMVLYCISHSIVLSALLSIVVSP